MGCSPSLPIRHHATAALPSRLDPSVHPNQATNSPCSFDASPSVFDIAFTQREQLLEELAALPERVTRKMTRLSEFDAADFVQATTKPVAILSMLIISQALNTDSAMLASLLIRLDEYAEQEGEEFQLHKVYTLQFIYCQTRPGGCLHRLVEEEAWLILALCLSAITYDVEKLRQKHMAKQQRQLSKAVDKRQRCSTDLMSDRRLTKTKSHALTVRHVLSISSYIRGMPVGESNKLLDAVTQISRVGDPNLFKEMLNKEKLLYVAQPDIHFLQATLIVAANSHLLRSFSVHRSWCDYMLSKLQRNVVVAAMDDSQHREFVFSPDDASSSTRRFAQCHAWVIDRIILPFIQMWARMACSESAKRLCLAASRTARTYDLMACLSVNNKGYIGEDYFATAPPDGLIDINKRRPGGITHASSEMRHTGGHAGMKTQPRRITMMSRSFSSSSATRQTGSPPNLAATQGCPLLHSNGDKGRDHLVRIPNDDAVGVVSICKMYNINAGELVVPRRNTCS